MLHGETIYFITKSNFYGPNLPPPLIFPNFRVMIWGLGVKISAYHINMRGADRHRICFFVFAGTQKDTCKTVWWQLRSVSAGTQKDTRNVDGEGAVFTGTQKDA